MKLTAQFESAPTAITILRKPLKGKILAQARPPAEFKQPSQWLLNSGILLAAAMVFFISTVASAKTKWSNKTSTLVRSQTRAEPVGTDVSGIREAILTLEPEVSFGTKLLKARIAPFFRFDAGVRSDATDRFIVDSKEISVGGKPSSQFRWAVGLLRFEWGMTDIYNPLDVVNPRNYTDLLNIEKRGSPAVHFEWSPDPWSLSLVYIPVQLPAILPSERSSWLPREVVRSRTVSAGSFGTVQAILPSNFKYRYTGSEIVSAAMNHNFGLKLDRRSGGFDFSIVAFQGASVAPGLSIDSGGTVISGPPYVIQLDPEVGLKRIEYTKRTAGLGFSWVLDPVIVKYSGAYADKTETKRTDISGWSHSHVFSFETSHAGPGESNVTWIFGATSQINEQDGENTVSSLDRVFDKAVLLGNRWAWGEKVSFLVGAVFDTKDKGILGRLTSDWKISDGVVLNFSVDILDGPPDSALGAYRNNDRLGLGLSWYL
jgi:hypothetical protein